MSKHNKIHQLNTSNYNDKIIYLKLSYNCYSMVYYNMIHNLYHDLTMNINENINKIHNQLSNIKKLLSLDIKIQTKKTSNK